MDGTVSGGASPYDREEALRGHAGPEATEGFSSVHQPATRGTPSGEASVQLEYSPDPRTSPSPSFEQVSQSDPAPQSQLKEGHELDPTTRQPEDLYPKKTVSPTREDRSPAGVPQIPPFADAERTLSDSLNPQTDAEETGVSNSHEWTTPNTSEGAEAPRALKTTEPTSPMGIKASDLNDAASEGQNSKTEGPISQGAEKGQGSPRDHHEDQTPLLPETSPQDAPNNQVPVSGDPENSDYSQIGTHIENSKTVGDMAVSSSANEDIGSSTSAGEQAPCAASENQSEDSDDEDLEESYGDEGFDTEEDE